MARGRALGLQVALFVSTVTPDRHREDGTMAHSVSIHRPRKHKPAPRFVEERPVLQLPLEAPQWREPPDRERSNPQIDRETHRGVVVIDFFI
jgi:hypothetical protein